MGLLDPKSSASTNFATGACGGYMIAMLSCASLIAGAKVVIFSK